MPVFIVADNELQLVEKMATAILMNQKGYNFQTPYVRKDGKLVVWYYANISNDKFLDELGKVTTLKDEDFINAINS